jgi:putative sugar O-methyltransferase
MQDKTPFQKISSAAKDPGLVYRALRSPSPGQDLFSLSKRVFGAKEYVGTKQNRSESDNGSYVAAVHAAVQSYKAFSTFKRHPDYQAVLEHVGREDGQRYLDIIRNDAPDFIDEIEMFQANDLVGAPQTFSYPGLGAISPTTLRYMKVASDLRKLFGRDLGGNIAEIGVGYGGQVLVNDRAFKIRRYDLFDLPPVLDLASKYLESHLLNCAYRTSTLNQYLDGAAYDLVISNYAFSELPSQLQRKYIEKVLAPARRAYLTMNSGISESAYQDNKLSLAELRQLLPEFVTLPEEPLTHPGNYIIVWGQAAAPSSSA